MFKKLLDQAKSISTESFDTISNKSAGLRKDISEFIPDEVKRQADKLSDNIGSMADSLGENYDSQLDTKETYCSWCFEKHSCTLDEKGGLTRNIYICNGCKKHIVKCRACSNKAKYSKHSASTQEQKEPGFWSNNFCAVHAGEIAKFETLNWKLGSIGEYRDIVERKDTNYKKIGNTAAYTIGGAAVIAPLALAAAPAIGGAIGTSILGLSGASATSGGLAMLGGGSLAVGGLGMAGGVAVVTATGSALGGRYGAVISNSYYGDIDGFEIIKTKQGTGTPIICIDGFLNEKVKDAPESWVSPISSLYPENPIYYVKWESKRLKDIASSFFAIGRDSTGKSFLTAAALSASKAAAKKLAPAGYALQALGLATNPWSVASVKAYETGALLADIIARTDEKYILVGHSLGARVIYSCLSALNTKDQQYIQDVHLLGGAVSSLCSQDESDIGKPNWYSIENSVSGKIYNYYSLNDNVLKYLYSAGEGVKLDFQSPIGRNKINNPKILNIDVSSDISGHTKYKESLESIIKK